MIRGLDVSHHQAIVNWSYWWEQGYRFVFIKVTEGIDHIDRRWWIHYNDALAAGYLIGPYHYLLPEFNGIAQAKHMLSVTSQAKWDLPHVCDVEADGTISQTSYLARVKAFLDEVRFGVNKRPVVYTSAYKWDKLVGNQPVDADLWAAHWTSRPSPYIPSAWNTWKFWQDKVVNNLDHDWWNGTYDELKAYCNIDNSYETRLKQVEGTVERIDGWIRNYEQ